MTVKSAWDIPYELESNSKPIADQDVIAAHIACIACMAYGPDAAYFV